MRTAAGHTSRPSRKFDATVVGGVGFLVVAVSSVLMGIGMVREHVPMTRTTAMAAA